MCTSAFSVCGNCGADLSINDEKFSNNVKYGEMWTVNGFVYPSLERYAWFVRAENARAAEDLTQMDFNGKHPHLTLYVTSVFVGQQEPQDTYTKFLDPDALDESQVAKIHIKLH